MARGSIIQRGTARFVIVIPEKDPITHKRKQHWITVKGTREDADARLAKEMNAIYTGAFDKPAKLTLGEWLEVWLRDYAAPNVRATTLRGYTGWIRGHIIPAIGRVALSALRPDHVRACHAKGRAAGLGKQSTLHLHRCLSKALQDAMVAGHIGRNVALLAKPPRLDPKPKLAFQPGIIGAFLAEARKTPYYDALTLDLFLALRRSELLGLQWQDVDFEHRRVSIRRTRHKVQGVKGIVVYPPKNASSARDVALSDMACLLLRSIRDQREAEQQSLGRRLAPGAWVFADATGAPMHPDTLTKVTKKIAGRAGIDAHLHLVRHWAASLALANGSTLQEVQQLLGHSTIAVTANIYAHLEEKTKAATAARMEQGIRNLLPSSVSDTPLER